MKKLKYLSILFLVILITGCGSKDGTKILEEALANMEKVESGTIVTKASVSVDGYALGMDLTTDFTKDGDTYTKSSSTILGMTFTSEVYTIVDGDTVYIYSTEDGEKWEYETLPASEYISEEDTVSSVGGIASNYKKVTEVKSDKKGHTKLEVVVDKDKMAENLAAEQELGSEASLNFDEDLTIYVYVKDGYITGLVLDLSDVMSVGDSESATSYSMEFTISNHNKIDKIEVPELVKESATLIDNNITEE